MTHVKALAERWLGEANDWELEAIGEEGNERMALDYKLRANQLRMRAAELEVAILEDEIDAGAFNPVAAQTPSRS